MSRSNVGKKAAIKMKTNTAKAAPLVYKQALIDETNEWMKSTDYNRWLMKTAMHDAKRAVRNGDIAG